MTRETAKNWTGEKSYEYQRECNIPVSYVHYGPCCPTEKKLKLFGKIKGKNILELGCGGAQNSIYFAKHGAKVIAIDISKDQLEYAAKLAEKHGVIDKIKFIQRDAQTLTPIKSGSQDIVFSVFALMYVADLKKCFKEVHRVLKKNGIFVFSADHPIWRIVSSKTLKVKRAYHETGKHVSSKSGRVGYMHKFETMFNPLVEAGFEVVKVIEPKRNLRDPDPWRNLWGYQPKKVSMVPPSIIFKAVKK